ncbi:hypothetical protein QOZ80_9AG0689930 [Eleusine coracana subsp. coracana]|nr:hypothetical protein QOZ80_9AG0689930 [Eleusine coracana subsp. coracana]
MPSWMNNPSNLVNLSYLSIAVRELRQEDLQILGRLPALHYLELEVGHEDLGIIGRFVVGAGLFPSLVYCKLQGFVGPVIFQEGAMPRLAWLELRFHVWEAREIIGSDDGFDIGLGNLLLLEDITIRFLCGVASEEVQEAKAAFRKAAEIHPNQPTLRIS